MAAVEADWLIGQVTLTSSATIVVGGSNVVIAADDYYLRDATSGISLIDTIQTGIAGVYAGSTVRVQRDRKIKIDLNGNNVTLVIPTALQAVLGFTSSPYAAATSRTAEAVSTHLWSPGWPMTTIGHPSGTEGFEVPNWEQTSSASGQTIRTTEHGTAAKATELFVEKVKRARVWTTNDGEPGEYRRFWREVIKGGYRWKRYAEITEDEASTTAVTWTTAVGPYKVRELDPLWWSRSIKASDSHSDITLKGTKTGEIS
jgi:hypothetical protein